MKPLSIVVSCADHPLVGLPEHTTGWGEDGSETTLTGEVKQILVDRDGESQFSIRILGDGQIIITDYTMGGFQTDIPRNLRLKPGRQWQ
jgi:hypothetical protein